jgi:signal peptidase I
MALRPCRAAAAPPPLCLRLDPSRAEGESKAMNQGDASLAAGPVRRAKRRSGAWRTIRFLLFLCLALLVLRTFVVAPFTIASGSMLPRMMIGDFLFVAQRPFGFSGLSRSFAGSRSGLFESRPERGDVVFFRHPVTGEDYVKRLIGLPGDTVEMRGGGLVLNGTEVPKVRIADYLMRVSPNSPCRYASPEAARPRVVEAGGTFCRYPRFRETLPGGKAYEVVDQWQSEADDTAVYTVPEGHYFMMGDNRDDSTDSRFEEEPDGVGVVPEEVLVGRAALVFFSTDGSAEWLKPWTWLSAARWERIGGTY